MVGAVELTTQLGAFVSAGNTYPADDLWNAMQAAIASRCTVRAPVHPTCPRMLRTPLAPPLGEKVRGPQSSCEDEYPPCRLVVLRRRQQLVLNVALP